MSNSQFLDHERDWRFLQDRVGRSGSGESLRPSDVEVERLFDELANRHFDSKEEAVTAAKRLSVLSWLQMEWLQERARRADVAAARRLFEYNETDEPPLPGDELPEGFVRTLP